MYATAEYLKLFDEVDGELFWKDNRGNVKAGSKAGSVSGKYRVTQIDGENHYNHVIVWVMHNGPVPSGMFVDHVKPSESLNNSINNLRLATRSDNNCNRRLFKNNKSGVKGVRWLPRDSLWQGRVTYKGKVHVAGSFKLLEDAAEAVKKLRIKLHKDFAQHE